MHKSLIINTLYNFYVSYVPIPMEVGTSCVKKNTTQFFSFNTLYFD